MTKIFMGVLVVMLALIIMQPLGEELRGVGVPIV